MMKNILLSITFSFVSINLYSQTSQLPILKLIGEFGYDYQDAIVSLYMPDDTSIENMTGKIKWRGGITNTEGKHKRNYKIKFDTDQQFFGLRKDNKWILDAGQVDLFRLRNRIATELWNDMAAKPYYADKEPDVLTGVRGQLVEVYINDEYRGIYCLTECIDRKQLKLKKFNKTTGEIKGGLWKSEGYGSSLMWECPDNYDNKSETWDVFEVKYPELDDLPETDYGTLWNAINFVANSTDKEFTQYVAEYFDIPVLIDYYIFLETLHAFDNIGKNMYWAVYDKTTDKKLTLAVWDLDGTVGAKWLGEWANPEYDMDINLYLYVRLKELNVDNFKEKIIERYHSLRNTYLSTESLIQRYTYYYELLKSSGATQREEEKWSEDSDINGEVINFDYEIEYIKDWINIHMSYLDREVFPTSSAIIQRPVDIIHDGYFYNLHGHKIKKEYIINKGIYIFGRKKYTFNSTPASVR